MTPEEIQEVAQHIAGQCRENWEAYSDDGVTYVDKVDCWKQSSQNMLENEDINDKTLRTEIRKVAIQLLSDWFKNRNLVIAEETEGGQKIIITEDSAFPVRIDLQGVHICTTLDENYVGMSLQDARELSEKLRTILSRYDKKISRLRSRQDWLEIFGISEQGK